MQTDTDTVKCGNWILTDLSVIKNAHPDLKKRIISITNALIKILNKLKLLLQEKQIKQTQTTINMELLKILPNKIVIEKKGGNGVITDVEKVQNHGKKGLRKIKM